MQRVKPPFRADHVGSLLRTAALKEAREKRARGEIGANALMAVEDREIEALIRKQEAIGLRAITDGEFRRRSWNFDFLERSPASNSITASARLNSTRRGRSRRPICCASPASSAARRRTRWSSISVSCARTPGDGESDPPVALLAAFSLRPRRRARKHLSVNG